MPRSVTTSRAPAARGPYSQGVVSGTMVYCSGQLGIDPDNGRLVGPTTALQTRQAIVNLRAVLEAVGSDLNRIVKTTVFLADVTDFAEMNAEYENLLGNSKPARTTVGASLPLQARVEIECVAEISRAD